MKLNYFSIEESLVKIILFLLCLSSFLQVAGVVFDFGLRYTTNILILTFLFSIFLIVFYIKKTKYYVNVNFIFTIALLFYLIFILILQGIFYPVLYDSSGRSALEYVKSYTLGGLLWLTIGYSLGLFKINVFDNKYIPFLIFSLLLLVLSFTDKIGFVVDYALLKTARSDDIDYSHLVIGHFVVILLLFSLALNKSIKLIYSILALVILFIVGGRSDLLVFIATLFIYKYLFEKKDVLYIILAIIPFLILSLLFFNLSFLKETKFYFLISGEQDGSLELREIIFRKTIENLYSQFLIGNPNKIITTDFGAPELYNNVGAYAHNIFSAWQFYGFLFFLVIIFYIFITTREVLNISFRGRGEGLDVILKFFILLFIFSTISLLITKSIIYYPLWLSMGYWLNKIKFKF